MHSEGILAGEMKHGPLALVDDTMPILGEWQWGTGALFASVDGWMTGWVGGWAGGRVVPMGCSRREWQRHLWGSLLGLQTNHTQ
jgi:hypothetical protein